MKILILKKESSLDNMVWKSDELPSTTGKYGGLWSFQEIVNRLRPVDADGDEETSAGRMGHIHRSWIKSHSEPHR